MDNKLYLLDSGKDTNKLTFHNEINSLEFVELICNMDLSYSVNYIKRDLYLKKLGQTLFKRIKQKKIKKSKIRIKINHDIVYVSKKASENKIKLFLKKLFKLNIVVNINILKFEKYSNSIVINKSKVLSQDEIDMLLTPIKCDDNNEKK